MGSRAAGALVLAVCALLFAAAFALHRRRRPGLALAAIVLLQGVAAGLALLRLVPPAVPAAVAPMALASLLVIGLRIPARRLKAVGWTAVAGSLAALAVLLAGLR